MKETQLSRSSGKLFWVQALKESLKKNSIVKEEIKIVEFSYNYFFKLV